MPSGRSCASNLRIYGSIATGPEHAARDLEDLLGCSVDMTEAETLHPQIRGQILEQALAL